MWRESPDQKSGFEMMAYLFGKTDSPCFANCALKKSSVDNEDSNLSVIKAIENDFYADDFPRYHSSMKYLTDITKSVFI